MVRGGRHGPWQSHGGLCHRASSCVAIFAPRNRLLESLPPTPVLRSFGFLEERKSSSLYEYRYEHEYGTVDLLVPVALTSYYRYSLTISRLRVVSKAVDFIMLRLRRHNKTS